MDSPPNQQLEATVVPDAAAHPVSDPVGQLMTIRDVVAEVRLSRAMIYRSMNDRANPFPKPIKFGNASRWSSIEIVAWKKRAIARRDNIVNIERV